MKKTIIALLCIITTFFVFASCTYGGSTDTDNETPAATEANESESDESESRKETEDEGWDIVTEGADSEPYTEETDESDRESESEVDTDDNNGNNEDENDESYPLADTENNGPWDPDVEEY